MAIIKGRDAEHIQVLRMKPGERIVVCDGKGTDYMCPPSCGPMKMKRKRRSSKSRPARRSHHFRHHFRRPCPRVDKSDLIVQKCTEAGANSIVFFDCERCVAPAKKNPSTASWALAEIAEAGAQAIRRGINPEIRFIGNYVEMLNAAMKCGAKLFYV